MMSRIITIVVVVPLAILLVALAVANRHPVMFTLDPFEPGNTGLSVELPLFVLLIVVLALGLVIGSLVTWFKQRRYRKLAREHREETRKAPSRHRDALAGPGG